VTNATQRTEKKVTRSELFAGAALILSAASLIFTGGIVYGDVQRNANDILDMKSEIRTKVDPAVLDIAGMKSDIKFLVKAEERRQGIRGNTNDY
jgi:hypothetical protein